MTPIRSALHLLPAIALVVTSCAAEDSDAPGEPLVGGPDYTETGELALTETNIIASREGDLVTVRLPVERLGSSSLPVTVDVAKTRYRPTQKRVGLFKEHRPQGAIHRFNLHLRGEDVGRPSVVVLIFFNSIVVRGTRYDVLHTIAVPIPRKVE